jgi:hypothetical protein
LRQRQWAWLKLAYKGLPAMSSKKNNNSFIKWKVFYR